MWDLKLALPTEILPLYRREVVPSNSCFRPRHPFRWGLDQHGLLGSVAYEHGVEGSCRLAGSYPFGGLSLGSRTLLVLLALSMSLIGGRD